MKLAPITVQGDPTYDIGLHCNRVPGLLVPVSSKYLRGIKTKGKSKRMSMPDWESKTILKELSLSRYYSIKLGVVTLIV